MIPEHLQKHIDQIPAAVRAKMSLGEQVARAIEAELWATKAAATGAGEHHRYLVHKASAILKAAPAHEVDAQVDLWRSRAAATGDAVLRSSYRALASQAREDNPQPSSESLHKAARLVPAAERRFGSAPRALVRDKTTGTVTETAHPGFAVTEPTGKQAGFLTKAAPTAPATAPAAAERYARLADQVTDRDLKNYYRAKAAEMRETS